MKATKLISLVMIFIMALSFDAIAQENATKKEYKTIQKHEKTLKKSLKKRTIKESRKEAKRLKKEGYVTPAGKLPLEKQLEDAWIKQYEVDAEGFPIYYVATQKATSGSYSAAAMQANSLAKMDLAGQIQTKVSQIVDARISNSELGQNEAATVTDVVSASKSVISATLGRTLPLVEIYRTLPNNNVEVMVMIGYSSEVATKVALQAIRDDLAKKSAELAKKLDNIVE